MLKETVATQLRMPHKRRRTLDTVSRADRQQLIFRATSEERKKMQKNLIAFAIAVAFLVATNVQAGLVTWKDVAPKAAQLDHIVTFVATPGETPQAAPDLSLSWGNAPHDTVIDGKYLVDIWENKATAAKRPQIMEFGLTDGYTGQYDDLGFFVKLGSTDFLSALEVSIVTYNGAKVVYDAIDINDIITGSKGDWLDLSSFVPQMTNGAMIRFTLDPTGYTGEVKLEVYGAATPEPATLAMLGLGLAGLGVARRRMKK